MNTADWIESEFERLAQSPEGIPKLREFVLQLAVQGKLVAQDSTDEPSSELLKRIAAEKEQLIKDGKIKKSKPLPPIEEDEIPFEIPDDWESVRLGMIGDWGAGATPKRGISEYYGGDISWFKSGELEDNEALRASEETVTEEALNNCSLRMDKPGDVLIAMYGATIGKLAILAEPATTNQAVCACTPFSEIYNRYLFLVLRALREAFTSQGVGGAQPNISKVKIVATVVPLPPLAEQHRIVAKVDELMALCDELEAKQAAKAQTKEALNSAALHHVRSATNPAELDSATRFYVGQMDTLADVPQAIPPIRETILQLAVQGKLVPQDPNDEPASELLKRIAAEKEQLAQQKKVRKPRTINVDSPTENYLLPESWRWALLDDLCYQITDGAHHTPTYVEKGIPFLSVKDMSSGRLSFSSCRYISQEQHQELCRRCNPEYGDVLLTKVGTTGIAVLNDAECPFSLFVSVALLKFPQRLIHGPFLSMQINSPMVRLQSESNTQGIGNKNLVLKLIRAFSVVLPPLAEQHRIVAKVDELMALCDQLEARLTTAQDLNQQLTQAILAQTA